MVFYPWEDRAVVDAFGDGDIEVKLQKPKHHSAKLVP